MNIAIITPFKSFPGGVESVNKMLETIFTQSGHDVEIISSDQNESSLLSKIMVRFIGLPYLTAKKFKMVKNRFDIVIANGEFGFWIHHPKAIVLFHGSFRGIRDQLKELWSFKSYLGLTRGIFLQKLGSKNKFVVSVSEYIKNILEKDGVLVDQVISNCVDTDFFKFKATEKKGQYLFVGSNNHFAKGFDVLEDLADKGLKIDCVTNCAPSNKLGWIRNVENRDMPKIYNDYKLLIFPSRFEGMSIVVLEAMSCGLPVVISNVGIGPELKRELPEFVVESYDSNEYLRKIDCIEKNYSKYSKLARQYIEKYHSYEHFKFQWLSLIERLKNA